jgi:hypothetical protein
MIKSWTDIDIELWSELNEIKRLKDTLTTTEFYIEIIAFLEEISPDDQIFDEMTSGELFEKINKSSWVWHIAETVPKPWNGMTPKPLNDLTFGEFIDLESFQADPEANLQAIAALLWRKTKEDDWGNTIWEPYEYDLETRKTLFLKAPITHVYPAIGTYQKWRQNFFENYAELFMTEQDQKEIEEVEDLGNHSRTQAKKAEILEERQKKWSWEALIWNMSGETMTQIIPLLQLPVLLVFNMLSMKHSLSENNTK